MQEIANSVEWLLQTCVALCLECNYAQNRVQSVVIQFFKYIGKGWGGHWSEAEAPILGYMYP